MTPDQQRRLLFILHRGLVEMRLLAMAGRMAELRDLADALEPMPAWMANWRPEYWSAVKQNLQTYASAHPDSFEYLQFLGEYEVPPF